MPSQLGCPTASSSSHLFGFWKGLGSSCIANTTEEASPFSQPAFIIVRQTWTQLHCQFARILLAALWPCALSHIGFSNHCRFRIATQHFCATRDTIGLGKNSAVMQNYFSQLTRVYLIAELGVNHNGDMGMARQMVSAAKRAGADAVKFQTFTAETLVTVGTPKVRYQEATTATEETHYEMIRKLELGRPQHRELAAFCADEGIDFISTPYDLESARFLSELNVKIFKTASADLVDLPLQRYIASTGKPAVVATGMANLGEVEQVVNIYEKSGNPQLVLLHCVSNYPCSDNSLNLRAMNTMAAAFGHPVGYSDHSEGFLAAALAVGMGARVIEKHFTLDKSLPGPDHKASSTPQEFADLEGNIRRAESMLGSPQKACQAEEQQMAEVSRKSLIVVRAIPAGETLTIEDLRLMRPGTGIPAIFIQQVVGKRVRANLDAQHRLHWTDLEPQ